ncbi:TPA: proline--tRNA ligase [bacterium]|nr:proline--tRNA ligase [bacterium]
MRLSSYFLHTLIEEPQDVEVTSHKLMLRAGLIKMLSSGIYIYLPLGLRVLRKIENIIREEMNRIGAIELLMPALSPSSLWEETGRWEAYGDDMFKFKDRKGGKFGLAPTHEEVICDIVRDKISSYKKLPFSLYQIQTKFRDEPRPRGGVIRAREFVMKDAYSFHQTDESANEVYGEFFEAYKRIFTRCGFSYIIVEAEGGIIGGSLTHEFIAPSENGEDTVFVCEKCGYSAGLEKAEVGKEVQCSNEEEKPLELVETPGLKSVVRVSSFLSEPPNKLIKTLILKADSRIVAVLIRGDDELNITKLKKVLDVNEISMADSETIEEVTGGPLGFSGPIGLSLKIIADYSIEDGCNFVVGANKEDHHYKNANLGRDFNVDSFFDLRYAKDGYLCPKCDGRLKEIKGIELGHCFKLGEKYSRVMGIKFLDEKGEKHYIVMGCYGIGVSRMIAGIIEQNYDKRGIIFPSAVAPFDCIVISIDPEKKGLSDDVCSRLLQEGIDVLYDDREESPGKKFADADLIGIPWQIIIGKKAEKEKLELSSRRTKESKFLPLDEIIKIIK